jgi:hypothetical protein
MATQLDTFFLPSSILPSGRVKAHVYLRHNRMAQGLLTSALSVAAVPLLPTRTNRALLPFTILRLETRCDSTLITGVQLPLSTSQKTTRNITTHTPHLPSPKSPPKTCTTVQQALISPRPARLSLELHIMGESSFFVATIPRYVSWLLAFVFLSNTLVCSVH